MEDQPMLLFQSPIRSPLRLGVRRTIAHLTRPHRTPIAPALTLDAKRVELRTLGRERGVAWLRETIARFKVEALGELPESAVDTLLAELASMPEAA